MPTENHENHEKDEPATPIPAPQIKTSDNGKESTESRQTRRSEHSTRKPQIVDIHKIPKINVVDSAEDQRIASTANRISRSAVIVNGVLLIATAIIATISYRQAVSADNAAKNCRKNS
jgi:hypothetical protein